MTEQELTQEKNRTGKGIRGQDMTIAGKTELDRTVFKETVAGEFRKDRSGLDRRNQDRTIQDTYESTGQCTM